MENSETRYAVKVSFEEIKLPPFQDILIVGRNAPQGRIGRLSKSLELLVPNSFEVMEITDEVNVDAVFINKRILSKIPKDKVIAVLRNKVFPYVSEGEILRVDFKVNVVFNTVEYEV